MGRPPEGEGWPLGIRHPMDATRSLLRVNLRDRALSTSGNYEEFFKVGDVVYSHILDPRTGRPAQGMLSVSTLTASATEGDALSTALFVQGVEETKAFCAARSDVTVVLVLQPPAGHEPEPITIGTIE